MTTPATVSVIIPARDRERSLARALASVAAQEVGPLEVIVVDDGSHDATADVARAWGATVVTHATPRGSGAARNSGVATAQGDLIAFLDSDDEWFPDHLANAASRIGENVLYTAPMLDSTGGWRGNVQLTFAPVRISDLFFPDNIVCTSATVTRRRDLQSLGGFADFARAQDLDMWIRLLETGSGIADSRPAGIYHVQSSYASAELRARSIRGFQDVLNHHKSAEWRTPRLLQSIHARVTWDEARSQMHRREGSPIADLLRACAKQPVIIADFTKIVRQRRAGRKRSNAYQVAQARP